MNCPTGKVRYKDELGAKMALTRIRAKKDKMQCGTRAEDHPYRCPQCLGWHLTSQSRRRP